MKKYFAALLILIVLLSTLVFARLSSAGHTTSEPRPKREPTLQINVNTVKGFNSSTLPVKQNTPPDSSGCVNRCS